MKKIFLKSTIITILFVCFYSCNQPATTSLKVMSYNIKHGEGLDTILDLSRAASIIKTQNPDLCGLQEIDNFCSRSDSVNQTAFIAEKTGLKGSFGKFMDYQNGAYGMATLAGLPVISTKVLALPDALYEPRTALIHEIQLQDGTLISFANVHFDWVNSVDGNNNRLKQAKALVTYLNFLNHPSIILGDFNCTPSSPTMHYFTSEGFVFIEKGTDNLSFQGNEKAEIDHVIYRNSNKVQFKPISIQLLDEPTASDHRPLVAELEVIID